MPQVSVVVPTYNEAEFVESALRSALNQSFEDLEVVVVDDGSSDRTLEIVRGIDDGRLRLFEHDENRGGSAARNTGVREATGEYVAFLDADDYWHMDKLARQYEHMESASDDVVGVYSDVERARSGAVASARVIVAKAFDDAAMLPKEGGHECAMEWFERARFPPMGSSTLFFKRSILTDIGSFDPEFSRHQDWELLMRVLSEGVVEYIDEPLVVKRQTSLPDPDTCHEATLRFLDKFSEFIDEVAADEEVIRRRYLMSSAVLYIRHGNINRGVSIIREYGFGTRYQVIELAWSLVLGLRRRFGSGMGD